MQDRVAVVGAPSSIGIRPDDQTGEPQQVDRAPGTLRELGVVRRLDAVDLGDVAPPPYQDFVRPPGQARNEAGVASYSRSLADRVAAGLDDGRFVVVLGGDCSIVLGCLLERNTGLRFTQLVAVLRELVAAPNWVALTICEVNPDHGELDGSTLRTFNDGLADILSGAIRLRS